MRIPRFIARLLRRGRASRPQTFAQLKANHPLFSDVETSYATLAGVRDDTPAKGD